MFNQWVVGIQSNYHVNAYVFAAIFASTFIPCWYGVYRIIRAIVKKNTNEIITWSIIEGILLVAPYAYIVIFGRNFPFWVYIVLMIVIVLSLYEGFSKIIKKHPNKSLLLWDICAFSYNLTIVYMIPHKRQFQDVVTKLNFHSGDKIFDAGCGAGILDEIIAQKKIKNLQIEAVDFSQKMLDKAKKRCKNLREINFKRVDLSKRTNYQENYFDKIVCIQTLFAVPDPQFTLKELYRILKPGGKFVLVDPRPEFNGFRLFLDHWQRSKGIRDIILSILILPFGFVVGLLNMIMDKWIRQGSYQMLDKNQWQNIFSKVGFRNVKFDITLAKQDWLITTIK